MSQRSKKQGMRSFDSRNAFAHKRQARWAKTAERQPRRRCTFELLEERTLLSIVPAGYQPARHDLFQYGGYLTGPQAGAPLEIAKGYLSAHSLDLGVSTTDIAQAIVTDQYTSADSGLTHIYLRQSLNSLEIVNANLNVSIAADGRILSVTGGFVSDLASMALTVPAANAELDVIDLTVSAARAVGFTAQTPPSLLASSSESFAVSATLQDSELSLDPIPTSTCYVYGPDGLHLAQTVVLRTPDNDHWYEILVDRSSGDALTVQDWVSHAGYNVYAMPVESPSDGGRTVVTDPADLTASPYGWHDTNGVAGAEYTDTRGNNVSAQEDTDANNSGGTRPDGGASLTFNYALDLTQSPSTYQSAAITNLFYWNNILHDVHYRYGFTEVAGNFQVKNYSGQGLGNDAVQADAQDGSGTNNANFATPPDGSAPRMQMYVFNKTSPYRDGDLDNMIIVHEYGHGVSNRLVGGPSNVNALNAVQSGSMGEGWSDWYGLMFTMKSTDTKMASYPVGTYVLGQATSGAGIRRYRYSYDMTVDPLTYGSFNGGYPNNEVHNAGEIWCSVLWDMTWLLIDKYGFGNNFAGGYNPSVAGLNGGNNLAMRLVEDSMKLMPTNPSFLQSRNAILQADVALTGGANQLAIWTAFARRGMGYSASDGGSGSATTVTQAFDIPASMLGTRVILQTPTGASTSAIDHIDLKFNQAIDPASFSIAADVTSFTGPSGADLLGSITGATWTATDTLRISFTPTVAEGLYSLVIGPQILSASGQVAMDQDSDGTAGEATDSYTANVRYDTLTLQVVSTAPANGGIVATPSGTIGFQFNEAIDAASVSTADLTVSAGTVTAVTVLSATEVQFTIGSLSSEQTLTYSLAAGSITDVYGNPMAAYSGNLLVDVSTVIFPPLTGQAPLGSLVYRGSATGRMDASDDTDRYTLTLNAGQLLCVYFLPSSGLAAAVSVLKPDGSVLGTTLATAAGQQLLLGTLPITVAGDYTVVVASADGSIGTYTLTASLNATLEAESVGGSTNDARATAQNLDTALVSQTGRTLGSVLGTLPATSGVSAVRAESFDSGPPLGTAWTTYSSLATGRIQVSNTYAAADGAYALLLDNNDSAGSAYNLNEAVWTVNLTGVASPSLVFSFATWGDELNNFNVDFTGHYNADGIAISADGVTWHPVWNSVSRTAGSWGQYTLNLASLAATHGIALGDNFKIKFQQYDNQNITSDGVGFDKISITTPTSTADWYSLSLAAGQALTAGVAIQTTGNAGLALYDNAGTLLAGGVSATNLNAAISNFVASASDTYFLRVTSTSASDFDYSMVVNIDAGWELESNDSIATAQDIAGMHGVTGYLSGTSDAGDYYSLLANNGDALRLSTVLPVNGPGIATDTLDAKLDLYDPNGNLVASDDNGAADGRNALIAYSATVTGRYVVRVRAAANLGEYGLLVDGANGGASAFTVASIVPANGAKLKVAPTTATLVLSDGVRIDSAQASDLLVNGAALATALSLGDGKTLTFSLPALTDGSYTLSMAAGSIVDLQGTPLAAFSSSFVLDRVGPCVVASSLAENDVVGVGTLTYTVDFGEDMDTAVLNVGDFALAGAATGSKTATSYAWVNARQMQITYGGLGEDSYTLTLFSTAGAFQDLCGNLLDGEPHSPYSLPSGNGSAGGDFMVHFFTDLAAVVLPAPTARSPLGSLVFEASASGGVFGSGDSDSFMIALDAGQSVTAYVIPVAGLRATISVTNPSGSVLSSAVAASNGAQVVLQLVPVATAGTYTFMVGSSGGTSGAYTIYVDLNAAVEAEAHSGAANDSLASAQALDAAWMNIDLSTQTQRMALLGSAPSGWTTTDFESGAAGFVINNNIRGTGTSAGLWHLSTRRASESGHSATTSFYYGSESTGTFNTGATNAGTITSPYWTLAATAPTLSFNYVLVTESLTSYDTADVLVSADGFATSTKVASRTTNLPNASAWSKVTIDLTAFAGKTVQIRWAFDTLDSILNDYEGFYVDDIQVTNATSWSDYYSVSLAAGDVVTAGLANLSGSGTSVALLGSDGATLATGASGPTNLSLATGAYLINATGTYYLKVSGTVAGAYNLLVTRNAALDREGNDSFATSQDLAGCGAAVGYLSGTADVGDYYRFKVLAGDNLVLGTSTPADGPYDFVNLLNPKLELYGPSGTLLASNDNSAADGRNALLNYVATSAGNYVVRVLSSAGAGEYGLAVQGNNLNPPSVVGSVPVTVGPTNAASVDFAVTFNKPLTGIATSAFTLATTGTAAGTIASVSATSGDTVTVTVNGLAGQGSLRLDIKDNSGICDTLGNPVGGSTAGASVTIDRVVPVVTSCVPSTTGPTNLASLTYSVMFSEAVQNVSVDDFQLTATGTATGSIASLSVYSTPGCAVTVIGISGDGTLRLDLKNVTDVQDVAGNVALAYTAGGVVTVDHTAAVQSITPSTPGPTNLASLTYAVSFGESVLNVSVDDFQLTTSGTVTGTITAVGDSSGSTITVTVSGITGDGTLRLDLKGGTDVQDAAGNPIAAFAAGSVTTIDTTAPAVLSITPDLAGPANDAALNCEVVFSENVLNLSTDDFQVTTTGSATATVGTITQTAVNRYTVTLVGIGGSGTLRLDLQAGTNVRDAAGNLAGPFTLGGVTSVDVALQVIRITPSLNAGTLVAGSRTLGVVYDHADMSSGTASNYDLRGAGSDGVWGSGDDAVVPVSVALSGSTATLLFLPLVEDVYRLTIHNVETDVGEWTKDFVVVPSSAVLASTPTYAGGGTAGYAITSGDFNGDGYADLATAVAEGVGVLLGNGQGGFGLPTLYTGGVSSPRGVVAGDFNRDGKLDLAVANYGTNNVSVLLGNGTGGFGAVAMFASGGSSAISVATADFNSDGNLDLVVANAGSNNFGVLVGNGAGSFSFLRTVASGGVSATSVSVGDVNADGKSDLLVVNNTTSSSMVGVLIGDGAGGFATAVSYGSGGASARNVIAADFNSDGKLDLVVANSGSANLGVLLNSGTGTFGAAQTFASGGTTTYYVEVGDFNADGKVDLAAPNLASAVVGVLLGNGSGGFGTATTFATGDRSPNAIAAVDINGDQMRDLAIIHNTTAKVGVLIGLGNGAFAGGPPTYATGGSAPYSVAVGDLNGDGRDDLVTANQSSNNCSVLLADAYGGFLSPATYGSGGTFPQAVALGDFDGNGAADIAVAHQSSSRVTMLLGTGTGTFTVASVTSTGGTTPYALATGDFNSDGMLDLVVANYGSVNVSLLLGLGTGEFASATLFATGGANPDSVAVGDFNRDGNLDLAVSNAGSNTVAVLWGNGAGSFAAAATFATGGTNPQCVAVGDFNGDDKLDLVVANNPSSTVGVLLGDGAGAFTAAVTYSTGGLSPYSVVVADLNNDGKSDLAVSNYSSGSVGVLLGAGNGTFLPVSLYASGGITNGPPDLAIGDFNRDGKPDVAVINKSNNTIAILPNIYGPSPVRLASPHAVAFDIATGQFGAGQIVDTSNGALNGGGRLTVGGQSYRPTHAGSTSADAGQTVVVNSGQHGGLNVSREVTVPNSGGQDFARTVDVFTNVTGETINTTVTILGNLGSDGATMVFATADGDTTPEAADGWIGTDDADGSGTPAVVHYIHGPKGLRPTSVSVVGDNITWAYDLSVAAGQTVRLAHYTIVADNRAAAIAATGALVQGNGFGGQAGAFLTQDELASLANFQFATAPSDIALSNATVKERQAVGAVVGQFSTTDADSGDTFTYRLPLDAGYADNSLFTINAAGQLQTAGVFDAMAKPSYTILVESTDSYGLTFTKTFVISVTNVAPTLEVAYLGGSLWKPGTLQAMAYAGAGDTAMGIRLVDGTSQLANSSTIVLSKPDQLTLRFNEAVNVTQSSLVLYNSQNQVIASTGFSKLDARTAQWTFAPLAANKYWFQVLSANTTDAGGLTLDGEWTTSSTTYATSGNGQPGGDLNFRFNVLAGDANGDGTVNVSDVLYLRPRLGAPLGATNWKTDLNASGGINTSDVISLRAWLGVSLGNFAEPTLPVVGGASLMGLALEDETASVPTDSATAVESNAVVVVIPPAIVTTSLTLDSAQATAAPFTAAALTAVVESSRPTATPAAAEPAPVAEPTVEVAPASDLATAIEPIQTPMPVADPLPEAAPLAWRTATDAAFADLAAAAYAPASSIDLGWVEPSGFAQSLLPNERRTLQSQYRLIRTSTAQSM